MTTLMPKRMRRGNSGQTWEAGRQMRSDPSLTEQGGPVRGTQPAWGTSQGEQPSWFFCPATLQSPVGSPGCLNPCSRDHSNNPRLRTRARRMKGGLQTWAVATVTSFYVTSSKSCQPLGDRKQSGGEKKKMKWEKTMLTRKRGGRTCFWWETIYIL